MVQYTETENQRVKQPYMWLLAVQVWDLCYFNDFEVEFT